MLIKKADDIRSSEITPKEIYLNRRKFLTGAAIAGAAALTGLSARSLLSPSARAFAGAFTVMLLDANQRVIDNLDPPPEAGKAKGARLDTIFVRAGQHDSDRDASVW